MTRCTRTLLPLVALALSFGLAAVAFAPAAAPDHATLASAFPLAQAQFAH